MMRKFLVYMWALCIAIPVWAQDIPEAPNPPRLVNDYAEVLPDGDEQQLERVLRAFSDSTSSQIVVVTVKSLGDYSANEFATELGHQWGVGQEGKDNGIVILVKPKYGNNDRGQAYIAVGYGLEGVIPDGMAGRIVDHEMIPEFKRNQYMIGVNKAAMVLMNLALGEFTAEQYTQRLQPKRARNVLPFILLFIGLIVLVVGRANRGRHHSVGGRSSFWTTLLLMSAFDGRHRGRWNDFSSGSGSFGGGGFGGFGGGGFGGGGAGGSW